LKFIRMKLFVTTSAQEGNKAKPYTSLPALNSKRGAQIYEYYFLRLLQYSGFLLCYNKSLDVSLLIRTTQFHEVYK